MEKSNEIDDNVMSQIPKGENKKKRSHHNKKREKSKESNSNEEDSEKSKRDQKEQNIIKDLIAENFVMLTLIGKGAFGQIFLSFNMRDNIEVAIKKEFKRPQKSSQLRTESKIYQSLLNITPQDITGVKALAQDEVQGVPRFYGMGELFDSYYMIMEFLGPNLIELFTYCNMKKFTISTVCLLGLQILNRIENLHKHHFLHRDIKPENFLIGTQEKSNIIYLIDFGLSRKFINSKNNQHIAYREGRPLTGTARYVSINTHLGIEQSRRDDLESIGYVLIFFLKGSLPWQGLKNGNDKYQRIMEKKLQIPTEILCFGLPDELVYYLNYCKSLRFEDRPDYDYLRGLFIKLLGTCNSVYGLTREMLKFDWCFDDPKNSIWLLFAKNKKNNNISTEEKETSNPFIKNDKDEDKDKDQEKEKEETGEDNNRKFLSKLGNIEKGDGTFCKTNENNPLILNEDNTSSSGANNKNDENNDNKSNSSNDTIKLEFNGVDRGKIADNEKVTSELNHILLQGQSYEDIDKYIDKLLNSSNLNSIRKDNEGEDETKNEEGSAREEEEDNTFVGGRKKLKDSLEISGSPRRPNNLKFIRELDKKTALSSRRNKKLLENTIKNSKIEVPEEIEKVMSFKKKSRDQEKVKFAEEEKNEDNKSKESSGSSMEKDKEKNKDKEKKKEESDTKKKKVICENNLITLNSSELNRQIIKVDSIQDKVSNVKVSKETIIKITKEPITKYYSILCDLGHGSYGQVMKVNHIQLGEERAMKIISKKATGAKNEIEILRKISHPNITNIFEIYEDQRKYYIMMEFLKGGELFDAIIKQGFFSEIEAMRIMKQLLSAVNYLHSMHITHRDLKPENIMLALPYDKSNKFDIKLIDFGAATFFTHNKKLTKFIGTSYYIAPEVIKQNYNEKCDIFSCGVILYILLCGYPPFNGGTNAEIFKNIEYNTPLFTGEEWAEITNDAIDLIKAMLNKSPTKRLSSEECLNHKWFKLMEDDMEGKSNVHVKKKLNIASVQKMARFVRENRLKQAVLQFISIQFDLKNEQNDYLELFRELDKNQKGQITKEVFMKELIELCGEKEGKEISNKIFERLDLDGSGEISYDEFLSAMSDSKKIVTEERLEKAFRMFDKDGNGKLSIEEIMEVFGGEKKIWEKVIEDVDLNKDKQIDFKEFKRMMLNIDKKKMFSEEKRKNG